MVTENFVQGGLVVPLALRQPPQHQHARHAELAAGELPGRVPPTHTDQAGASPRGSSSPVCTSITWVVASGSCPAPRTAPVPTRAPSTTMQREPTNASSSTTTGTAFGGSSTPPMPTPPDRWTFLPICAHGADGGPGVHHGAGVDVGPDVHERRHQHRARGHVGPPADDGAGHRADALQVRGQRHPVVVAEVADLGADHRQEPEREQDGPLGPLVHDDLAGVRVRPRHPRRAGVERSTAAVTISRAAASSGSSSARRSHSSSIRTDKIERGGTTAEDGDTFMASEPSGRTSD